MRLALVISSSYTESSVVVPREGFLDTSALVQSRLTQDDTGFRVVTLAANRDLPEHLEALLDEHQGNLQELLIHFSGYVAVKSDRGPALLLDGGRLRAFPMSRLRSALGQAAPHVFVMMDVVAMADPGIRAATVASDVGRALHDLTPHVSVMTSASLPEHADVNRRGCSRMTDLWLLALGYEAAHARDALVFAGPVVRNLQSEHISFSDLPSFDYQTSEQDFLLMPGLQVGGFSKADSTLNSATERSLGVEPPGSETDPALPNRSDDKPHRGDTYVDELAPDARRPALATEEDIQQDEDHPTPRPRASSAPMFDLPMPAPPPIPKPVSPPGAHSEADWADRASYLPSVPPPTVLPKLPTPPPTAPQAQLDSAYRGGTGGALSFETSNDVATLEQMVDAADRSGDPRQRIELRYRLALLLGTAFEQKGQVLYEAAEIALRELNELTHAYELVQQSLSVDAHNAEAFGLCMQILIRTNHFPEIVRRCSDVLTRSPEPALRYQASCQLVMLLETQGVSIDLDASVIEKLREAVREDDELRVRVAQALRPHSDFEETLLIIQETLQNNSRHVQSLQALSDVAEHEHALDTASLASSIVICLGEGRPEDDERAARISNDGLPLVTRTLIDRDVEENLLGSMASIAHLRALGTAVRVAVAAGLTKESSRGNLSKDATILDPALSTTTLARSLAWAARFVSVTPPVLVMAPELVAPMELSVGDESRLFLSKQLGSGFGLAQLAFLGARQLAYLRPEFMWRAAFDSHERLSKVLGYCVRFAHQGPDFFKALEDDDRKFAKRFASYLEDDASLAAHLTNNFADFDPDPAICDQVAQHWTLVADCAALRIGLLACANPLAAWNLIAQLPQSGAMSPDEQLDEIASFAISQGHQALRKSLGLI
jgi:hypothetical protein